MTEKLLEPQDKISEKIEKTDLTKNYMIFFSGQLVSLFGSSIVQFIIIWYITIIYQSGLYLSLAALAGFGSQFIVGLFAGVIADRYNRKAIIFISDFLQALVTIVLMYLFYTDVAGINHLLLLLFIRGALSGLQAPAVQAILPSMVPKERLSRIMAISSFSNSLINITTPVFAAIFLGIFGVDNMVPLLAIDAATFFVALVPLIFVFIPNEHIEIRKQKQIDVESSFFSEFKEGFRVIKEGHGLIALLISYGFTNFFLIGFLTFMPLIVSSSEGLDSGEVVFAIGMSSFQLGILLVSTTLIKVKITSGLVKKVTFGILSAFIGMIIAGSGVIIKNNYIFWFGIMITGMALPFAAISSQVIWQTYFTADFQGRVMTVRQTFSQVIMPVSMISIGTLIEFYPASLKYIIFSSGLLGFVFYILVYSFTKIKTIDHYLENKSTGSEGVILAMEKTNLDGPSQILTENAQPIK